MERREFIKKSAIGSAALAGMEVPRWAMPTDALAFGTGGGIDVEEGVGILEQGKEKNIAPEIRPEILNNPRAVFLIETHVSVSPDSRGFFADAQPEMEKIGKSVLQQVFVKGSRKGGSTIVKPNFTYVHDEVISPVCGVITSPDFVAGFVQGLRELGNTNVITAARGAGVVNHRKSGIYTVLDKYDIKLMEPMYNKFADYGKNDFNWHKVTDPVVMKNIPTYRPIGDADNFFINMPKLKCHCVGLTTLAIKNLQGAVPTGYGHYCERWDVYPLVARTSGINYERDFVQDYQQRVEAAFLKHRAAGFKHWDYEKSYPKYEAKGGWGAFKKVRENVKDKAEFMKDLPELMWDETWCQRAIDSATAIKPAINIIEGVIGRDGSGFYTGKDELCNVVIVGLSMPEVDAIGTYIMGHDPNELFYTHIAKERGLGECDPGKIDLYWIREGRIEKANLADVKRYRLGVNMHVWKETGERLFW